MAAGYDWNLPQGFPRTPVPADNPISPAKVELGPRLFDNKSDVGKRKGTLREPSSPGVGVHGRTRPSRRRDRPSSSTTRHEPGDLWLTPHHLTGANPSLTSFKEQALVPMLGEAEPEFIVTLRRDRIYRRLLPEAFPGESDPYDLAT